MRLTIIGSGAAVIKEQRKSTSLLLEVNKRLLLFDCGWGCGRKNFKGKLIIAKDLQVIKI